MMRGVFLSSKTIVSLRPNASSKKLCNICPLVRSGTRHISDTQDKDKLETRSINEIAKSIDTTLTPAQKIYVEKLKKLIKGGKNSPRCKLLRI